MGPEAVQMERRKENANTISGISIPASPASTFRCRNLTSGYSLQSFLCGILCHTSVATLYSVEWIWKEAAVA
jgi:hypothetical protein